MLARHTSSFGPCSFAACAPKLWNSLPPSLRDPTRTNKTLSIECYLVTSSRHVLSFIVILSVFV